ncbi:MAG: T9SS type A sorting domain-containing protein, partial [Bacteroidota bacterium]
NLPQFRCVVVSPGCSDTSIVATLTVGLSSGTLSNVQESIVRVYPIPVNKILNIQLRNDKINIPFALIDCLGNLVLQGQLINHENVIDLSEVAAGIYTFIVDGRQSFPIAITAE